MDGTLLRHLAGDNLARLRVYPRAAWSTIRGRRSREGRLVAFGAHPQQHALLFVPPESVRMSPVRLYFMHGGGWRNGDPRTYSFMGWALAARGFVTAIGGYRLAPTFRFPAQLDDAFAGFTATREEVASLCGSEDSGGKKRARWVVGGFSAGGHLAALMAFDRQAQARSHLYGRGCPAGLLSISSPLDLSLYGTPWPGSMLHDLLGPEVDPRSASPIEFVRGDERLECLLVQGERDPHVPSEMATRFAQALNDGRRPGPASLLQVEWMHHADLARLFLEDLPETERIVAWLSAR